MSRWIALRRHPQHGRIPYQRRNATAYIYESEAVAYDEAMTIEELRTGRECNTMSRIDVHACLVYADGTIEVPDLNLRWTVEQFRALYPPRT